LLPASRCTPSPSADRERKENRYTAVGGIQVGVGAVLGEGSLYRQPDDQRPSGDSGHQERVQASLARRRCIIPADAFYEWQVREVDGRKRKAPYVIRHRDGSPLAFAGLWEVWHDAEDQPLRTCAIFTTDANRLLLPIHDRMPVVLPPKAWEQWLDPENEDVERLENLLVPAPAREFQAYEVTTRVNNVRNDGPELVAPARS
jgi:putative SOS response-associated peptidase YedK